MGVCECVCVCVLKRRNYFDSHAVYWCHLILPMVNRPEASVPPESALGRQNLVLCFTSTLSKPAF